MLDKFRETDQLRYTDLLKTKIECLVHLGKEEEALDLLEQSFQQPYGFQPRGIRLQLRFASMWDHPRFIEMVNDPKYRAPLY